MQSGHWNFNRIVKAMLWESRILAQSFDAYCHTFGAYSRLVWWSTVHSERISNGIRIKRCPFTWFSKVYTWSCQRLEYFRYILCLLEFDHRTRSTAGHFINAADIPWDSYAKHQAINWDRISNHGRYVSFIENSVSNVYGNVILLWNHLEYFFLKLFFFQSKREINLFFYFDL